MGNIWALVRRELHAYFASPIGYVALALFLFFYGFYFYGELEIFIDTKRASPGQVLNVNQDMIRWLLHTTAFIILFLLPLVTMRSFSEEFRSGTIELLFTSPLTDLEIVLGKFFGALALYVIMLGSTLVHIGILFYFGDPEWKPIVVGYLGLFLLGAGYIAFGLLFSSMTKNQINAGFMAFQLFVFLYLIELAESWGGWAASVVPYLSVSRHLAEFAKGVLDTRDIVYYLSFIGFGLFLTKQSIESYRWRG